jgi:hypothetical protein
VGKKHHQYLHTKHWRFSYQTAAPNHRFGWRGRSKWVSPGQTLCLFSNRLGDRFLVGTSLWTFLVVTYLRLTPDFTPVFPKLICWVLEPALQTLHNLESQFTMIGNTYLNGKDGSLGSMWHADAVLISGGLNMTASTTGFVLRVQLESSFRPDRTLLLRSL